MTGKRMRLVALFLAASLFVLPLSETRLYAAEAGASLETEEQTQSSTQSTMDEIESERDTQSGTEEESRSAALSEADTEAERETESEPESAVEEGTIEKSTIAETATEPVTESEPETMSEAVMEAELMAEDESESETEPETEMDYPCPVQLEPENVPYDENQDALTRYLAGGGRTRSTLPEQYDARKEGYLPEIRNQNPWGSCWSFSLLGTMEVSAIRDMGIATDAVDLSERHLAYFGYNTGYDALGNANEDTMSTLDKYYYLRNGGNDFRGVIRLMNWNGGAAEQDYPYVAGDNPDALDRTAAQDAKLYLENAYRYDFASAITDKVNEEEIVNLEKKAEAIKVVKKMIADYGAVSWSYYNDQKYMNNATNAYYNNVGGSGGAKTNHAIMAVGWDDNYAKENFKEGSQPENDGAWIIRNSWGKGAGDGGYFYMSYEDVSLGSGNPVYVYKVCDTSKYDNNYFYGNTAYASKTIAVAGAAQVFQMKSQNAAREKLTAVSFLIGTSGVDYEIQIYKNPDLENGKVVNPASGTPVFGTPQKGRTDYAGLHTIELETPVMLDVGDYVSVVLSFPKTRPNMYFDRSYSSDGGNQKGVHNLAEGRSFFSSNLTTWGDNYAENRTFRINALTVDCDDIVEIPEIKKTHVIESQGFDQFPQILIRWSKCTGAQEYRVYRSGDNVDYELIDTVGNSGTEYTDTLPERKAGKYYYKVEAVYSNGAESSNIASESVKGVIEAPKLTLSAYDGYQAAFTWDAVSGADAYEIWQVAGKGSADGDAAKIADFSADAERVYEIDTDGWELGKYYYKLCAVCGDERTTWSEACINRNLIWKQNSYYRAFFEWLPVDGATSYKLFHKVNGRTLSATVNRTSATMKMESTSYYPCDEHQYYIKAYDGAGSEIGTGISSTIVFRMTPDALSIDSIEYDDANTVTMTWSGGLGAEKIAVYRSENPSGSGELIAEVASDAKTGAEAVRYQDTVCKGKAYWYHLVPVAIGMDGASVEGQTVTADKISTFVEAAGLETAQYTEGNGVSLSWKAAKGAEGYLIERNDNQNGYTALATVEGGDAVTYTDQSAEAGNSYQYRALSYFTSEDGSRETVPEANALTVEIIPNPVTISEIAELKRDAADKQNNRTRVTLSWSAPQVGESYVVYRSTVSDGVPGNYARISENITKGQYTDNTAVPDTSYCYKLVVAKNGLTSELEKTEAKAFTTKPALAALEASSESMELVRGADQMFKITPKPEHYPYKEELVWSAYDENGNALELIWKNDTLVINGIDGKEILFIEKDTIHAVHDSETVKVTLVAAIDEIRTECSIFVYNNDFWVRGVKDFTYTGAAIKQDLEVYNGNRLLTEGVDYTVAYKNNVKVSMQETEERKKPAVIVKGKGNYAGTKTIYFEILPEPVSDANKTSLIKATVKSIGTFQYQGTAIEPKPVVKIGSKTLVEGTDYTLSYKNNDGVGKAVVAIKGINDYKGTKEASFTVSYNIQKDDAKLMRVTIDTLDVPYAKGGAKPTPQVYCGSRLLKEGTDYKLSYKNNKAIAGASDKKAPTVVITGKGNYKGRREATFNIVKQDIRTLTLTAKDKFYTGKAGKFTTSFSITDEDGKKLSAGRDYDKKSIVYTYAETGEPVGNTDIVPQGTKIRITVNAAEKGAYQGSVSGIYRMAAYDIGKAKVTVEPQIYTGSAIEPHSDTGVKVTYKGYASGLTEGVDYEITGYSNNIKKGTAKLYLKGLGDFGGTKTINFKIKTKTLQWWWQK